jgi:hypothetical protein
LVTIRSGNYIAILYILNTNIMATKKTKTTPPAEATKPAENPDFVFKFTLEADQTITFQNGSKQDYSIQEILGVVMHFIFGQSKQVFDKVMTDHPELTDEQKEDEVYNIIVYNVITTQMLMFQTLNNLF